MIGYKYIHGIPSIITNPGVTDAMIEQKSTTHHYAV